MSDTVNLLAFGTDVIGSADTGGSGSGGHTIENPSGTDMAQRANLQFTDAVVADDSTNDRTEISIVRELMQAEFDELTPEEQNKGVIVIKDANPPYLPSDNAVSVTADGVKTYTTLLNELYALVDTDKVTRNSSVVRTMATGEQQVFRVAVVTENLIVATYSYTASTTSASPQNSIHIKASGSNFYSYLLSGTVSDVSSAVPASGVILTLYYNILSTTSSGGSGGHTIENTSGTDMEQRSDLQFVGVYTEDDSANDRTKVNVVREMTKAQMDALSAAEKVGFIRTSDEADNPYQHINASDVSYGSATVEDALDDVNDELTTKYIKCRFVEQTVTFPANTSNISISFATELADIDSSNILTIIGVNIGSFGFPYIGNDGYTIIYSMNKGTKTVVVNNTAGAWTDYKFRCLVFYT